MAFADGTIKQRTDLVSAATNVSVTGRRMSHGSLPITAGTAAEIDAQCQSLQQSMEALGYAAELGDTQVKVSNGDSIPVVNSFGNAVTGTHTAEIADGVLTDVKLSNTVYPIVNGASSIKVANSAGTQITSGATATVSAGIATIRLPAGYAAVVNNGTVSVGGKTYTFTVANGVITGITVA